MARTGHTALGGTEREKPPHVPGGAASYLGALGPGLVTGAADDDPAGIATYAQSGSRFQFKLAWVALITLPLMAAIQEMCDRTALATGENLGQLARRRFPSKGRALMALLVATLIIANTLNVTADLLAVGAGMNLLHAGPVSVWAFVAGAVVSAFVMSGSFPFIARALKLLCLCLFSYIGVLFFAHVPWTQVLRATFVPHIELSRDFLGLLVAVLGTTISPYLFFWQSEHRVEDLEADAVGGDRAVPLRQRPRNEARIKHRRSRVDVFAGMALSNFVMFAVIVATGATLGRDHAGNIDSAADAARALEPLAGSAAKILFAFGFIGTGLLAVPVLAGSAASATSGLAGRAGGFSRQLREAPLFYAIVAVGTIGGTLLSLIHVSPIKMLLVVALINGLVCAPFLIVVVLIASDRRLMGRYANGRLAKTLGWATTALMTVAAAAVVITTIG